MHTPVQRRDFIAFDYSYVISTVLIYEYKCKSTLGFLHIVILYIEFELAALLTRRHSRTHVPRNSKDNSTAHSADLRVDEGMALF